MHFLPFLAALLIIGIAELGDKTQFLTISFAAKYPMEKVIYGVSAASAILMLLTVLLGKIIQRFIPMIFISILAGAFFIIYGLMLIAPISKEKKEENETSLTGSKDPFWIVFGSFFLAELGDRTQFAALALTAKYRSPVQIWFGSTIALIVVSLFGIVIGNVLKNYLPDRIIKYLIGVIFIIFGAITFLSMAVRI